jgi:hypothetical protein
VCNVRARLPSQVIPNNHTTTHSLCTAEFLSPRLYQPPVPHSETAKAALSLEINSPPTRTSTVVQLSITWLLPLYQTSTSKLDSMTILYSTDRGFLPQIQTLNIFLYVTLLHRDMILIRNACKRSANRLGTSEPKRRARRMNFPFLFFLFFSSFGSWTLKLVFDFFLHQSGNWQPPLLLRLAVWRFGLAC